MAGTLERSHDHVFARGTVRDAPLSPPPVPPAILPAPMFVPQRKQTVPVRVGNITVGGNHPVVVQSMTNTDTADAVATADQVADLFLAGSEVVRITVNTQEAAAAVPEIRQRLTDRGLAVPLVGDFHYNGHVLLRKYPACAEALDKYRINPGNVGKGANHDKNFATMVQCAVEHEKPVRIGVNAGSLDQELLSSLMEVNARSADPAGRDGDLPRGDGAERAALGTRSGRTRPAAATRSSSAARSARCRNWCASTEPSPTAPTTRCTSA